MYKPIVSIIIPVYNGSNFLSESIESALAQTYDNIEIIVVNDGSKDEGATESIALAYGDKIRYYSKSNGGVSSALNLGIQKMNGEWFSWLSHDDLYTADKIEKQIIEINKLMNSDKGLLNKRIVILSNSILIDIHGNELKRSIKFKSGHYSGKQMFSATLKGLGINGCSFLLPHKCFDEVGFFNTDLKYIQDYDLWYKLMIKGYEFYCIDHKSVKMRVHGGQVTAKHPGLFYIEREKVGVSLVNNIMNSYDNNYDILLDYLDSCARKGNNAVGKYILNIMKENEKRYKFIYVSYIMKSIAFKYINLLKGCFKDLYYKKNRRE